MQGLRVGSLKDKLFTDDTLMYLNDAQSSLITTLWIFDRFGHYSGIRINWSKADQTYLQWVQQFKYLGIYIPLHPRYFLNVTLIISQLNSKCEAWSSLPLLVVGRANLIQIIFLPKFTYVFRQSLVWIPQQIFWRIHTVLSASIPLEEHSGPYNSILIGQVWPYPLCTFTIWHLLWSLLTGGFLSLLEIQL